MRTVILGPRPPEIDALIARRHALGQDTHDEVWEGEYHMSPAPHQRHGMVAIAMYDALRDRIRESGLLVTTEFNLGEPDNFRVPDLGIFRDQRPTMWVATAAMVVEVVSPGDESWSKFDHYAAHGVGEVVIVDPADHAVAIFVLDDGRYRRDDRSRLLDLTSAEILSSVDWPPAADG